MWGQVNLKIVNEPFSAFLYNHIQDGLSTAVSYTGHCLPPSIYLSHIHDLPL